MFHRRKQAANIDDMRRTTPCLLLVIAATSCRIGEHIADPPIDGRPGALIDAPAAELDAPDAPPAATGLRATIGERPEVTGSCNALDDRAEMMDRFEPPLQAQDVTAGWEFDTDADSYADPSYGFMPPWPSAQSGRFSLRFSGRITLDVGPHCFSVDIGATGTDIIGGRNGCGQIWLGAAASATAETGYEAATSGTATGCIDVTAAGPVDLVIVFWYFNIFERARLQIRHCAGAACTPAEMLSVPNLQP
jgi:hypothetical protein